MADSKTYLNVPFAHKDEAKALGARWDAANKKWYVPTNKDVSLFAKWQILPSPTTLPSPPAKNNSLSAESKNGSPGVFTYPTITDFIAYDGDEPPWD